MLQFKCEQSCNTFVKENGCTSWCSLNGIFLILALIVYLSDIDWDVMLKKNSLKIFTTTQQKIYQTKKNCKFKNF